MQFFLSLLKKHTTIRTKAILLLYLVVVLFSYVTSLIEFSLVRFLKSGLGNSFLLIGTILSVANILVVVLDIPFGVVQKYIRPRKMILASTILLLIANLIFLLSTLSFWMSLLAVLFYALGNQLFFITITTYILKLSTKADYTENIAQADIADRVGSLFGFGFGGALFLMDSFLVAHHAFVAGVLVLITLFILVLVFEFMDRDNYSELEKGIFEQNLMKKLQSSASSLADQMIQNEPIPENPSEIVKPLEEKNKKIVPGEIWNSIQDAHKDFFSIFSNASQTKILIWAMLVLAFTNIWYNTITFFTPVLLQDVFQEGKGWIQANISPYLYQSVMCILAIAIPTFFLELPLSKLADQWGKQKVIIVGLFVCAVSLIIVALIPGVITFFLIFLVLSVGFTIITPPVIGLIGEELNRFMRSIKVADADGNIEDQSGNSAAFIAIATNVGVIISGILGGFLLQILDFNTVFLLFGIGIMAMAVFSLLFIKYLIPETK